MFSAPDVVPSSVLNIRLYLQQCYVVGFSGDNPEAPNVTMLLLAFSAGQYYTPFCLLPSMCTRKSALMELGTMRPIWD